MFRVLILLGAVLVSLMPSVAFAAMPSAWIRVTSVEIDTRTAGNKTVDLRSVPGSFRGLRLKSDRPVTGLTVVTRVLNEPRAELALALMPATPSGAIYTSATASFVDGVDLAWKGDAATGGLVTIEIWGHQTDVEAAAKRPAGGPGVRSVETAAKPADDAPATAPAPAKRSPAPSSRSVMVSPPPPPAPSSAPVGATPAASVPVAGGSRGQAEGPACVAQNVCTALDVFFGTDRVQIVGPDRVSFSGDRAYVASPTLGKAIVTIPKAKREVGTITRPWQERYFGVKVKGDPSVHFTIPDNGVKVYASEAAFLADVKANMAAGGTFKDHAFIYVHGFGVTFENAMYRAAQISYDLSTDGRPFGTAFVYTWPSAGKTDPFSYAYDQDSADGAAKNLLAFVDLVTQKTGVSNVHIIAHSMGNRVLVRAFDKLPATGTTVKLNQIILAAPDYDKKQFEDIVEGVSRSAKGVTLYASSKDAALGFASKSRGWTPRAGEVKQPPGPALAVGVDTIDISALSTDIFSWGHDTYADSKELLTDMKSILTSSSAHPPTARNAARFETLREGTFQYWKYRGGV